MPRTRVSRHACGSSGSTATIDRPAGADHPRRSACRRHHEREAARVRRRDRRARDRRVLGQLVPDRRGAGHRRRGACSWWSVDGLAVRRWRKEGLIVAAAAVVKARDRAGRAATTTASRPSKIVSAERLTRALVVKYGLTRAACPCPRRHVDVDPRRKIDGVPCGRRSSTPPQLEGRGQLRAPRRAARPIRGRRAAGGARALRPP